MMVDIEALFKKCTMGKPNFQITGSIVSDFVKAPFMVWCHWNAPEEEKDPDSLYQKLLLEMGIDHEKRTISTKYPNAKILEFESEEE